MTKYYALIGPKLDGPALNSAMSACSIEPSIRQVPRLYVNSWSVLPMPRSCSHHTCSNDHILTIHFSSVKTFIPHGVTFKDIED